MPASNQTNSHSMIRALRTLTLSLLALIIGVMAVLFASNHIRLGFENEYIMGFDNKIREIALASSKMIDGNYLAADPSLAGNKYGHVLSPILLNHGEKTVLGTKHYGIYSYSNGSLLPLYQSRGESLNAGDLAVSQWLTSQGIPYEIKKEGSFTILIPIKSSDGAIVGLYEVTGSYPFLYTRGAALERSVLLTAIVSLFVGLLLFSFHYFLPALLSYSKSQPENRKGVAP